MKIFNQANLFWKIVAAILAVSVIVLGVRLLSGPEDTWLCQNGEWVKHGQPSAPQPISVCGGQNLNPEDQAQKEILVTTPRPGQTVASPVTVEGQARGSWFFEAVFPVELADSQGQVLGRGQAQAQGDSWTENFVPFKAEINYQAVATSTGKLVLRNDNPSGLLRNEKSFTVPVVIRPSLTIIVKAFFNNNNLDKEITCTKVFAVERRIAETTAVARASLEDLLKGPAVEEQAQGYYTNINPGVKIQKLTISQGTAKVDFDESLQSKAGGSCRVSAIRAQITQTLKQFPTVKNVIISINGRTEDILQP